MLMHQQPEIWQCPACLSKWPAFGPLDGKRKKKVADAKHPGKTCWQMKTEQPTTKE